MKRKRSKRLTEVNPKGRIDVLAFRLVERKLSEMDNGLGKYLWHSGLSGIVEQAITQVLPRKPLNGDWLAMLEQSVNIEKKHLDHKR